jgi:RNA polymerase sigma factor (sigma-70 family)
MGEAMHDAGNAATISSSLLERVQANDDESWRRIYSLYAPVVLFWCRKWGLRDPDAQDAIQEVFKTVAVKIKTFVKDGAPGAFRRWLCTITRFKVCDIRRRAAGEPEARGGSTHQAGLVEVPTNDSESDGEEEKYPSDRQMERRLLVRRALEQVEDEFQPRTWKVMWSVVVEGRSAKDVAEQFGMKVGAVYKAKSVVLSRLRESLSEYEELL